MKYPITLIGVAAVMFLVGVGIRMHADWRYTNKMFYHTVESGLYDFEDVFAERKTGDTTEFWSLIAGVAGVCWSVAVKIRRDQPKRV